MSTVTKPEQIVLLRKLLEVDQNELTRTVTEGSESVAWPGSNEAPTAVNRRLRWAILSGEALPALRGNVKAEIVNGNGVMISARPPRSTPRKRTVVPIPDEVVSELRSVETVRELALLVTALVNAGWTQSEVSRELGASRQWVHILYNSVNSREKLPVVPDRVDPQPIIPPTTPSLRLSRVISSIGGASVVDGLIERYGALPAVYGRIRGRDKKKAHQVREFWEDVRALLTTTGVSPYALSNAMGLSTHTVPNALRRYGLLG